MIEKTKNKSYFFPLLILTLLILAFVTVKTFYFTDVSNETSYASHIPMNINNWVGSELPVEDFVKNILETKDIIYRRYEHSNEKNEKDIFLSVVFSQDNRKIVHPPEVCYSGGGWDVFSDIKQKGIFNDREIDFKELLVKKGNTQQVVWYFFKAGNNLTVNYYKQQLNVVFNKLLRRKSGACLIRFSAVFASDIELDDARIALDHFVKDSLPDILETIP